MGKIKFLIITGGLLILSGIILKIIGISGIIPVLCFSIGGLLKLLYLILGVISKKLKLGQEIYLLIIGLALLFTGIWLKNTVDFKHLYVWLLSAGIIAKLTFVILFINRQKH